MNVHFLFDIDNTLTVYRDHAMDRLLFGNFLFPVLSELAQSHGLAAAEAERRIAKTMAEVKFWDYPDFMRALGLSAGEALPVLRQWHRENLNVHADAVWLVRHLCKKGNPVSVISNNPRIGCLLKLEQCGLADSESGKTVFRNLLSTDAIYGCKGDSGAWRRAVSLLRSQGEGPLAMVGDNEREDGILALEHGVRRAFLLDRENRKFTAPCGCLVFDNADGITEYLKRHPEECSG